MSKDVSRETPAEKEAVAELLLQAGAIQLRPKQPFRFASGILSPLYCDNRLLLSKPRERERLTESYVRKIVEESLEPEVIAGIATASIPWAALIAQKLRKPMIYIRKDTKDHGKENLIEGGLEKGQRVLVIEDLVSTGATSLASVESARREGAVVEDCLAIFTYELEAAKRSFERANCRLIALSNLSTLSRVAVKKGYLKEEELQIVLKWAEHPEAWGREH